MAFTSQTATVSVFLPVSRYANEPVFNIASTARLPSTILSTGETVDQPDDENRARDREVEKRPETIRAWSTADRTTLRPRCLSPISSPWSPSYPFPRCNFRLCIFFDLFLASGPCCCPLSLSSPVIHPTARIYFVRLSPSLPYSTWLISMPARCGFHAGGSSHSTRLVLNGAVTR